MRQVMVRLAYARRVMRDEAEFDRMTGGRKYWVHHFYEHFVNEAERGVRAIQPTMIGVHLLLWILDAVYYAEMARYVLTGRMPDFMLDADPYGTTFGRNE